MDFVCLFLFADVEYDSEADELGSSESSHNCRRAGGFLREELLAFVAKFSDPEEVEGFELLRSNELDQINELLSTGRHQCLISSPLLEFQCANHERVQPLRFQHPKIFLKTFTSKF